MASSLEQGPSEDDRHCTINIITGHMKASSLGSVYWHCIDILDCDRLTKNTGQVHVIIDVMSDPVKIVYDPEKELYDGED